MVCHQKWLFLMGYVKKLRKRNLMETTIGFTLILVSIVFEKE